MTSQQEQIHIQALQYLDKIASQSQMAPRLGNQYLEDTALTTYLPLFYQDQTVEQRIKMENDLKQFGLKVVSREYLDMMRDAESNPPRLDQFDGYGRRIDKIHTSEGWRFLKNQAALEKLIQIPYKHSIEGDQDFHPNCRLHQIVKLYLFGPSSALVSCPLAMTDGAAFTIREIKRSASQFMDKDLEDAYKHLTSDNPKEFWTSGQWMTEKKGGSDVSRGTETFALEKDSKRCYLYGYKWFSSATDANITLALARFPKDQKEIEQNKGQLALVFLKLRRPNKQLNNIEVVRLKDKLGTRQLPTAELLLKGSEARRISEVGKGVKVMSNMLAITRVHNAIASIAGMRRIIALANDYKERRSSFGKMLKEHDLYINTLGLLEMTFRGHLLMLMECGIMLQEWDFKKDSPMKQDLRLFTPILKLFSAKDCMWVISEGIECIGGLGYMENTGIPRILRDAQVTPIWEGTTNILSLDFAQEIFKNFKPNIEIIMKHIIVNYDELKVDGMLSKQLISILQDYSQKYIQSLETIRKSKDVELIKGQSRTIAFNFGLLLINHIFLKRVMPVYNSKQSEISVFVHWMNRLQRDYKDPYDIYQQNLQTQNNRSLLSCEAIGKDTQEGFVPRHKL